MRLIKDTSEIKNMQVAADLASKAHIQAMVKTHPGLYEYNIAAEFDSVFRNEKLTALVPSRLLQEGKNACILHYTENNKLLNDGDLLLIDGWL